MADCLSPSAPEGLHAHRKVAVLPPYHNKSGEGAAISAMPK
jgi:hypothetical protein